MEVLLLHGLAGEPRVLEGGGGGVPGLGLLDDELADEVLRRIADMRPLRVWEVVVGAEDLLKQHILAWGIEWWEAT